MITPTASLKILWGGWALLWFLGAAWSARTVARESAASRLLYTVLMGIGSVMVFFGWDFGMFYDSMYPRTPMIAWLGVALTVIGLGFTVWARVQIGRFWSGTVTLKEGHELIRSGPYAITRHPIYTGLLFALIGTAVTVDRVGVVPGLVLVTAGIVAKVRSEERLLLEHFGDAYRDYRAQVPALIPRPW